jgi:hypothetical protein
MRRNGLLGCLLWLILSMSALSSAHAAEPDWQMVGKSDECSVWVDAASLQSEGNIVKAWTKLEYKVATPIFKGSEKMNLSVRRREYLNCSAHSSLLKSAASFSERNLQGAVVASFNDAGEMVWEDAAPGTIADAILEFACAKAPKQ